MTPGQQRALVETAIEVQDHTQLAVSALRQGSTQHARDHWLAAKDRIEQLLKVAGIWEVKQ